MFGISGKVISSLKWRFNSLCKGHAAVQVQLSRGSETFSHCHLAVVGPTIK